METSQAEGGTRSGLLWEVERILSECEQKPQILVMENVIQIHSEKDYPHFEKWMLRLEELGYCNFYADLNAKDYGIPQNRVRTFMVSILGSELNYKFPQPFKRELNLKDMLIENAPNKYYLSDKMIDYLTGVNQKESKYDRGSVFERNFDPNKDVAATITTLAGQRATDNFVIEEQYSTESLERISKNLLEEDANESPTITANAMQSINHQNCVLIQEATQKGYAEAEEGDGVDIGSRMHTHRGNVQKGMAQTLKTTMEVGVVVSEDEDEENTFCKAELDLFTEDGNIKRYVNSDIVDEFKEGQMATTTYPNGYGHGPRTHDESISLNTIDRPVVKKNLRIRKLMPIEAGRLMGFQDIDTEHLYEAGLKDAGIYHVFGDSICVNVLIGIFARLFGLDYKEIEKICKNYINSIIKRD